MSYYRVENADKIREAKKIKQERQMAESPTNAPETEQARRKRSIEYKYIQPPTQKPRFMEFRLATMHNCIFICSCCHRQEFKSSVQEMENIYITIP